MELGKKFEEFLADYDASAICDANLDRLRGEDPDAARIFAGLSFTGWLTDRTQIAPLGRALEEYAASKLAADRMDLYRQRFAGTDNE